MGGGEGERGQREEKKKKLRKKFRLISFICVTILPVYMHMYHTHAQCRQKSEEGVDPLEPELQDVLDGCESPYG